jgi:hypothetical protein
MTNDQEKMLALSKRVAASDSMSVLERRALVVEFEHAVLGCAMPDDQELIDELSPFFPDLNLAYERYETELETEFSEKLLKNRVELREYALYNRFVGLLTNEIRLLEAEPGDQLAMIGSGPFPISALILATAFGMRVIAVERNPNSASLSSRVVRHLDLEHAIQVACGYGEELISGEVRHAIVALLARPKEAILNNVFKNYARCSSAICRTSHGLRQALYAPAESRALKSYDIRDTHLARGDQTISSMLLSRSLARWRPSALNR